MRLVAIGCSWGGLHAVSRILSQLERADLAGAAVVVAQHRGPDAAEGGLADLLEQTAAVHVADAFDKQPIEPAHVYLAPPDYHLLVEPGAFALSVDARVQHARPSIDVLFESAADAYGESVVGVVLTGANEDGAAGLRRIKERGGATVVQDPATAERSEMPAAAIAAADPDLVLPLDEIAPHLRRLVRAPEATHA